MTTAQPGSDVPENANRTASPNNETQDSPEKPRNAARFEDWWEAARPHTWPNAFAPVIAGTGAAAFWSSADIGRALLALGVAWALIVGVNFANDYSDGIRGTDEDRTGPTRLTASGLARPEDVKLAAFVAFGLSALLGIVLSIMSSPWLILIGAICIAAAWFYTGGSRPYGYAGFGEIAVFIFFGLVAVMGTEFVQTGFVSGIGFLAAIAIGAISAAVNLANNIRDIETDAAAGKNTLAVRLGYGSSRLLFTALTLVPFVVSLLLGTISTPALLGLAALPFAVSAILTVQSGATGKELIPVLGMNGRAMLVWAIVTALALWWAGAQIAAIQSHIYDASPSGGIDASREDAQYPDVVGHIARERFF
ncbi:1,4-dihydroxy-2-naphthoate octaprenyltransferase [Corynebacterium glaucum]|uniref:1,4-dihydroxy-2-naphthoate polyprenyltransferase n=1 Tax=Corynebacterium glaucum TaxID=187491 RepID=UPI0025B4BF06|nr:1,4-dihydroxy-2-naphthoate polyprenyltransferase [Corynebacterium glaucum]WJZ06810.1 1,4-dihydroxy-2-naphthoate octaprenyltransferase [Corynebacterium glaucum]